MKAEMVYEGDTLKYDDVKKYLSQVVRIDLKEKNVNHLEKALKEVDDNTELNDQEVWVLYGEKKNEELVCLLVGATISLIKEIKDNIQLMFTDDKEDKDIKHDIKVVEYYNVISSSKFNINNKYFAFKEMTKEYDKLIFYTLNIDRYLNNTDNLSEYSKLMVDKSKKYLAEVKFADETRSVYWNICKSGIRNDFAAEIIKNTKKKNIAPKSIKIDLKPKLTRYGSLEISYSQNVIKVLKEELTSLFVEIGEDTYFLCAVFNPPKMSSERSRMILDFTNTLRNNPNLRIPTYKNFSHINFIPSRFKIMGINSEDFLFISGVLKFLKLDAFDKFLRYAERKPDLIRKYSDETKFYISLIDNYKGNNSLQF